MPELAEVEAARKSVEKICKGLTISKIVTKEEGGGPRDGLFDEKIFQDSFSPFSDTLQNDIEHTFHQHLTGKIIKSGKRRGKQMYFELEGTDLCVLFHFGMTGSFVIRDQPIPYYKTHKIEYTSWPPKYSKMQLEFTNGVQVAFLDPRRLARVLLRTDPLNTDPIAKLGIDPVIDGIPDAETLQDLFSAYTCPIKALLLDQQKVFCGIGNWLADEILFQARIHPENPSNTLSIAGITAMGNAMEYILSTAIASDALKDNLPSDWLFHYRWDKRLSASSPCHMPDGKRIQFIEAGGRTTAIVPSLQIYRHKSVCDAERLQRKGATRGKGKGVAKLSLSAASVSAEIEGVYIDTPDLKRNSQVLSTPPHTVLSERMSTGKALRSRLTTAETSLERTQIAFESSGSRIEERNDHLSPLVKRKLDIDWQEPPKKKDKKLLFSADTDETASETSSPGLTKDVVRMKTHTRAVSKKKTKDRSVISFDSFRYIPGPQSLERIDTVLRVEKRSDSATQRISTDTKKTKFTIQSCEKSAKGESVATVRRSARLLSSSNGLK